MATNPISRRSKEPVAVKVRIYKTSEPGYRSLMRRILQRRGSREGNVEQRVTEIVRARCSDKATARYCVTFGSLTDSNHSRHDGSESQRDRASDDDSARQGSRHFASGKRITAFHRRQLQKSWHYRDSLGMVLGQRITPLERVGVYVPGGKASYPSTVLMNVLPAKVAGVKEIIMTSPIGNDAAIILRHQNRRG